MTVNRTKKIILTIFAVLILIIATFLIIQRMDSNTVEKYYSEDYYSEEYNAINQLFLELIDTSYYYHVEWYPMLWSDDFLFQQAKNPENDEDDLSYFDSLYYPFKYSEKIIQTQGNPNKMELFKKDFECHRDSMAKKLKNWGLKMFVTDSLYHEQDYSMEWLAAQNVLKYVSFNLPKEFPKARYFDMSKIESGKFELTRELYEWNPPKHIDAKNQKINIGYIEFSRVIFNKNMNEGLLYFVYRYSGLEGYKLIVLIKKINGIWMIEKEIVSRQA